MGSFMLEAHTLEGTINIAFELVSLSLSDCLQRFLILNSFADLAKLILILNAASVHDPVCSLLPAFAVRHYKFLRCSMPLLVPTIEVSFPLLNYLRYSTKSKNMFLTNFLGIFG